MPRYKPYNPDQMKLLPVSFAQQILPGTFEYTLNELIDNDIDLSIFDAHYKNDEVGAPAYDPAILLKIVLYAYSRGVTSSRQIERLCRENIIFMALSADTAPHFTTIADFISRMDGEAVSVFRDVLLICDEAGLIGREMFAVDGVKLPSNASKEWSGTRADLAKKARKMERAVRVLMGQHREADRRSDSPDMVSARERQVRTLRAAVKKVKGFLADNDDKVGPSGRIKKSNLTDNESAKMKTAKGVIQGYTAVAVVDAKHQIIVNAKAFGEGQEQSLLKPMVEGAREHLVSIGHDGQVLEDTILIGDSGYHSEANAKYLLESELDGYLADHLFRRRDPRFQSAPRHRPKHEAQPRFGPKDFRVAEDLSHAICPAGKRLYRNGANVEVRGYQGTKFTGAKRDCEHCALRAQCLKYPERTPVRQFVYFRGRAPGQPPTYSALMKAKIDSPAGRYQYSRRLGTVEPVFANIRSTRKLERFSLRGRVKVNVQWQLYALVHNIGKIQRYAGLT